IKGGDKSAQGRGDRRSRSQTGSGRPLRPVQGSKGQYSCETEGWLGSGRSDRNKHRRNYPEARVMSVRNHARLKIISRSVTPEEITARLGLNPDRIRHAGQLRPHTTIIESTNCWEVHSELPEHCGLHEHISAVLRRVERCVRQVAELAEESEVL